MVCFTKEEIQKIVNIIDSDKSIKEQKLAIEEIGSIAKLKKSVQNKRWHGYHGMTMDFVRLQEWLDKLPAHKAAERKVKTEMLIQKKVENLLYLNGLYTRGLLDEKHYYSFYRKLSPIVRNSGNVLLGLKNSERIPRDNIEVKKALENIDELIRIIKGFHKKEIQKSFEFRKQIDDFFDGNNYLENYAYAEYIIKAYIDSESCYRISTFLTCANMKKEEFQECIKIIKAINPVLYEEYLNKAKEDSKKNYIACQETFKTLAKEISTHQENGTSMPKSEFLMKAPFMVYFEKRPKIRISYIEKLYYFVHDPSVKEVIARYLYQNKLDIIEYINVKTRLKDMISFQGYSLTEEDKDNIMHIMKTLNICSTGPTFQKVVEDYIHNQYNMEKLENPSIQRNKELVQRLQDNPYVYQKNA